VYNAYVKNAYVRQARRRFWHKFHGITAALHSRLGLKNISIKCQRTPEIEAMKNSSVGI
jgi:hypothetical protein